MDSAEQERRRVRRAHVELEVDLATYGKYFLSKLENISIGGAFIKTQTLYPTGTEMKISFRLPGESKPIESTAEVMWTYTQPAGAKQNASGMGVRFKTIDPGDRERIATFVMSFKDD